MLIAVFVVFGFVISLTTEVHASYSGNILGRSNNKGYFYNGTGSGTYDTVLPLYFRDVPSDPTSPMVAIPSYVDSPSEFVQLLIDANNDTDSSADIRHQRQVGSAFIVNTMLGRTAPGTTVVDSGNPAQVNNTKVSYDDFQRLLDTLNSPGITIDWNVSNLSNADTINGTSSCVNSSFLPGANGGKGDVVFFADSNSCHTDRNGIKISYNGSTVYKLWRYCANPVGNISMSSGLWSITPRVEVSDEYVAPNADISWTHTITNNGPSATDQSVRYYYLQSFPLADGVNPVNWANNLDLTNSTGWVEVSGSPMVASSGSGTSKSYTYSHVTAQSSGTVCRVTIADPQSSGNNTPIVSSPACVTVGNATSNQCRPIKIDITPFQHLDAGHDSDHPYTDEQLVTMEVIGYNQYAGANPQTVNNLMGRHVDATEILQGGNLTKTLTTGDVWNIARNLDDHTEGWHRECSGTGINRHCWWVPDWEDPDEEDTGISIGPCYDFKLRSEIGISATSGGSTYKVEATTAINVTPTVHTRSATGSYHTKSGNKIGDGQPGDPTEWQLTRLMFKPGTNVPNIANGNSLNDPCAYFRSQAVSQGSVSNGNDIDCAPENGTSVFTANNINDRLGDIEAIEQDGVNILQSHRKSIPGDRPAGTKICYVFSVKNYSSETVDNSKWNHSALNNSATGNGSCVIIVKKPKVQVLGSDLITNNGKITTITSIKDNRYYGSWVEYGILPNHSIVGMASGSKFNHSNGVADDVLTNSLLSYSNLSFANNNNTINPASSCSSSDIGCYGFSRVSPVNQIDNHFVSPVAASANIDISTSPQGVYAYNSGDATISAPANYELSGKWIVIKIHDTATISSDIKYTQSSLAGINNIPQLVIIADNINIDPGVTRVDAWLVSKNTIRDCPNHDSDSLTVDPGDNPNCTDKLEINGPVMAKTLYLRRTYGYPDVGTIDIKDPAEKINLRADAYLWAYSRAVLDSSLNTVYITEVAPRL